MKLIKIYPNGEKAVVEYSDEVAEALLKSNPDRFMKFEEEEFEPEKEINETLEYKPRKKFKFIDKSDES